MKVISSKQLKAGMTIATFYQNEGRDFMVEAYEFLGFTDDKQAYGKGEIIKFKSSKELLTHYKVKTMKELEALQNKNKYGYESYMVVRDVVTDEIGAYFYLFEGRWCRGSGADKLSFKLIA